MKKIDRDRDSPIGSVLQVHRDLVRETLSRRDTALREPGSTVKVATSVEVDPLATENKPRRQVGRNREED